MHGVPEPLSQAQEMLCGQGSSPGEGLSLQQVASEPALPPGWQHPLTPQGCSCSSPGSQHAGISILGVPGWAGTSPRDPLGVSPDKTQLRKL